ncbi:lantibiotic dehydratase [Streptomyces sp. NRRL B-24720]|uniref:lantibiotic dehydratase n=1 Tax=Streptomyces sp. NRRL B-24720 TaxID=1476876 RepID=UPI00068E1D62|nr:lantibiotic dehydratase [Streptomyces sp. NRRL B-24720]
MAKLAFKAAAPLLLRLSALTREDFATSSPRHDAQGSPTSDELIAYIQSITRSEAFREAVEVSSSSLGDMLRRVETGPVPGRKRLLGAALSLTRYMLRATGRPTPFGLQAGVAPLTAGPRAKSVISGPGTKNVRLDAGWFDAKVSGWLVEPRIRHAVQLVANNLCFIRDGRLVLPYARSETAGQEVSVRHTLFVKWVLARTAQPTVWADLLDDAEQTFAEVPRQQLDGLIAKLVQNEFVLTSLSPNTLDDAFLSEVHRILAQCPEELVALREIEVALAAFGDAAVGEGIARWRQATELGAVAQVDLSMAAEATVPPPVIKEIERYATTLWNMTPETPTYSHMREYREAFMDKYGEHGAVRLSDLVDPHVGLGFPRGYENPRVSRDARLAAYEDTGKAPRDVARAERMGRLIQQGMLSAEREITLSPSDVTALSVEKDFPPPPSLELTFQMLAPSTESLDTGDFQLVASPMIGSGTAGASMGRFASLVGIEDEMSQLAEASVAGGGMVAQITFRPRNPRTLNVIQVPDITPYEIPVGQFHEASSPRHIDWRDLIIAADGRRLRVIHEGTGQEVHPIVPHMLNVEHQAPNVARFLAEIRHSGDPRALQIWDWSGFVSAPWLPRVRLGKVILSPLSWRPSIDMRDSVHSPSQWEEAVECWRAEAAVDDCVCVTRADMTYEIDLRDPFHRELLRRDVAKGHVKVTESIRKLGELGWSGGRANEIVVPLLGTPGAAEQEPVPSSVPAVTPVVHHSPGGDWFYAQVLAVPETHDDVICAFDDMMRKATDVVDKWYFLRFFSPEPHLRLRAKTLHAGAVPQLLQALEELRAQRMIREFRLCSYEPEIVRYGGPDANEPAEQIFCLDSQTVAAQLRLLRTGATSMGRELMATANYAMLLDSLGTWDWPAWLGAALKKSTDGSVTRSAIDQATNLIVPQATAQNLEETLGITGLSSMWHESTAPRALSGALKGDAATRQRAILSHLHMQHNRLIGIDRASEMRTLTLLGHVARAHIGRTTSRRTGS